MGMTVALVAFDLAFARLPCASPCGVQADGVLSGATPVKDEGGFWRIFASLLGQGVFWQVDVLEAIINQSHPD